MYFQTDRLLTRKMEMDDIDAFHELQSNYNVMKFILGRTKTRDENIDELRKIINNYKYDNPDILVMGISSINDCQSSLLGTCAIIKSENGEFEIGYRFLEKYWGKGYGTEILAGLIEYCLNDLTLHSVISIVDKDNIPSVKILENSPMNFIEEYEENDTKNIVRLYKIEKLSI